MNKYRWPLIALIGLLLTSCGATSGETRKGGRDLNLLTREEITSAQVRNAFELIQRERPRWLTARGIRSTSSPTEVVVYMNTTPLGGISTLRDISLEGIEMIRFLDASQASARLPAAGVSITGGVIQLLTAVGSR
jgi:hypothetical protein